MSVIFDGERHIQTFSLWSDHLGHSIDLMRQSKRVLRTRKKVGRVLAHRYAFSSILHGFCALESILNFLCFEMFTNSRSRRFVPQEKRDSLTDEFVNKWKKARATAIEKLEFVLRYSEGKSMPPKLGDRLRELNYLRNLIAHGFSYVITYLVEEERPVTTRRGLKGTEYIEAEIEENVDWKTKFPNTRFKGLRDLDFDDAKTALVVVLEVMKVISECMKQPIWVTTYDPKAGGQLLWDDGFDISKLLES